METCLESVFHKYLNTNSNSKNYAKNITKLITLLIYQGRFLEARFYLDQLERIHIGHIISIRLGYKLAIALFDHKSVVKYDNLLFLNRKCNFELEWYRLQYYYSVNNIPQIRGSSKFLLSNNNLEKTYMETILQITWNVHDYELAVMVHKYAMKNKLRLTSQMDHSIRSRALEKLRNSLSMYKNV